MHQPVSWVMGWNETAVFKQCISTKTYISNMTLFIHLNHPQFCGSEIQITEIKPMKIKVCYSKSWKESHFSRYADINPALFKHLFKDTTGVSSTGYWNRLGCGRRLSHKMKKWDKGGYVENFMMLLIHTLPVLSSRLITSNKT